MRSPTIERKPEVKGQVPVANKFAMPIGTGILIEYSKFKWDMRDVGCGRCRNGMKSVITKVISGVNYTVPLVCTCVPYTQSKDVEGNEVVLYKGRRELWPKGVRPEAAIQEEMMRKQAFLAAMQRRQDMMDSAKVGPKTKDKFVLQPMSAAEMAEFGVSGDELKNFIPKIEGESKVEKEKPTVKRTLVRTPAGNLAYVPVEAKVEVKKETPKTTENTIIEAPKKQRGRPKGSGKKQETPKASSDTAKPDDGIEL